MTVTGNHRMAEDYADEYKLFRTPWQRFGLVLGFVAWVFVPTYFDEKFFDVNLLIPLTSAGVFAIGAIGLNLLIGYTGQISLGHAFFMGVGAYTAAYLGDDRGWPMLAYLAAAVVVGFVVGAVSGPFALRLRGDYLVVVTIGLVVIGDHLWKNWRSVSGGPGGRSVITSTNIGPVDIEAISFLGMDFTKLQGHFWFIWALVVLCALLARNLVRSRAGRAMQAIRDRDLSAEVIGVSLARYKIGAFAVSGAMAALAGALYAVLIQGFVSPVDFELLLSINFVAMIIIGGLGSIHGAVIGAVVITTLPRIVEERSDVFWLDWLIKEPTESGFGVLAAQLNLILFGALIVVFLLVEPRGLAALWFRIKAYFRTWPFSY